MPLKHTRAFCGIMGIKDHDRMVTLEVMYQVCYIMVSGIKERIPSMVPNAN
jgi:hypothetical protein